MPQKELTAMMQLIEWIETTDEIKFEHLSSWRKFKAKAIELLPVERKMVEDAHQNGYYCGNDIANNINPEFKSSSDYFTNKYLSK